MLKPKKGVLVLIGFAEALSAPEVAWSLVDAGFDVEAFARKGRRSALRLSRHVVVHEIEAPETNAALARSGLEALLTSLAEDKRERHVFLPLDDSAVLLGEGIVDSSLWKVAGVEGRCATLALDKGIQVEEAKAAGFNVPESFLASSKSDFAARVLGFPLIARPAAAASIRGGIFTKGRNWICSDPSELDAALAAWDGDGALLVQPFIQGVGEGLFGLATASGVIAWSAHKRLRMMNPHGSGSSACMSQPVPEEARTAAESLMGRSGWRGLFMIEMLRDGAGKLWFVELNGRPWGSMALARRLGLEYPAWAVELALDPFSKPLVPAPPLNPVECRNVGREVMHMLFTLRGPKSKAMKRWPSRWKTLWDLLQIRHGTALYNWRSDDPRVFFGDFWYTIRANLFKPAARAHDA